MGGFALTVAVATLIRLGLACGGGPPLADTGTDAASGDASPDAAMETSAPLPCSGSAAFSDRREICRRQFVLGVPRALRFPLARDAALRRATVGILCRTVFMRQRRLARADGFVHVMPGAVSFLHEAGAALNLNPHPHGIIPDGVFICEPDEPAFFLELPPPSQPELEALDYQICHDPSSSSAVSCAAVALEE